MRRINVDFKQPMRAKRRAAKRVQKARVLAPKPTGLLRPIVRPSCIKHSHKLRLGQGSPSKNLGWQIYLFLSLNLLELLLIKEGRISPWKPLREMSIGLRNTNPSLS